MTPVSSSKFGPEVLLIFIGHSDEADGEAEAVLGVERDLQRVLEQHLEVANGTLIFKTVRLWEWNRDAPPGVGGQAQVISPIIDRANAAVFLFKERIGRVTWSELERCRDRNTPAIAVTAFFPENSPPGKRLTDPAVVAAWLELLEKKQALTADWTAPESRSLTPTPDYRDADHLKGLVLEQLKGAIARLLRPQPLKAAAAPPPAPPGKFLADHEHLNYDRRPVLSHTVEELDQDLLRVFLEKPLSQRPLTQPKLRGPARPTTAEHLRLLGCLSDSRPTLGAFLCFAPAPLLADKFDCCSIQLVVYSGTARASSRPSITEARGNLLELFEEGMLWLTTQSGLLCRGHVGTANRDELEIPEIVLREVLANAIVHRDYEAPALKDQPTRVEVYADRVEVTSFGSLPQTVPVESLNSDPERVAPYRRNPVIARVFQYMSHVELLASGVPRMRSEMEKASLPPPRFTHDLHESIVRVVLLRPSEWAEAPELPAPPGYAGPGGPPRVFISSTGELAEHHRSVKDACLRSGFAPVAWEDFSAGAAEVPNLLDEADIYLGIFANRYGTILSGHDISGTELEYNHAIERGIPRLLFLMHEDHPIRSRDIEKGPGAEKLERLKERVSREPLVKFFKSPDDLRAQVIQSLAEWRGRLPRGQRGDHKPSSPAGGRELPAPPEPYVPHPYTLRQALVGRHTELDLLTDWVATPGSESYAARLYCLVALGGMGKSALAWKWFHDIAPQDMKPLAGRVWWSFDESGSNFDDFVTHALAYVSGRAAEEVGRLPSPQRERQLLAALDREPYLLVLDGLERLLLAYASPTDAGDEQAPGSLRQTADRRVGGVLRRLTQTRAARILVTTRLFPAELQTPTGDPIPGSHVHLLTGLPDADVLELWGTLGVRGSRDTLLSLSRQVENHPLALQILAGQVASYRRAPGDFDRWLRDNPTFDEFLRTASAVQGKSGVLHFALRGLDDRGRSVLAAVAACRGSASYEALSASLVGAGRPLPSEADLNDVLSDLEERGLIGWDRKANHYDIHPIVRAATSGLRG